MRFKHPAEAMRAKILGDLCCGTCARFDADDTINNWCRRQDKYPGTRRPFGEIYCEEYKRSTRKEFDYTPSHIPAARWAEEEEK